MHIPRSDLNAYGDALSAISKQAQSEIISAAKSVRGLPIADARDLLIGEFTRIESKYGAAAAVEASGFFESILPSKFPAPTIIAGINDETINSQVRSAMKFMVDENYEGFETRLGNSMDRYVKKSAREVPISAAKQYGGMIRYARIPSGKTTCSFCVMLASRGFVYHTGKAAGEMVRFHGNCDCYVVPGLKDGTSVEGYDPDELYDEWDKARANAGVQHDGELTAKEHELISEELKRIKEAQNIPRLTPDEREAVQWYVRGDGMWINDHLRSLAPSSEISKNESDLLKLITFATNKTLDPSIGTLYRSVDARAVFGKINDADFESIRGAIIYNDKRDMAKAADILDRAIGREITDRGFMSTTKDAQIALKWEDFSGSDMPIVLELEVPSGIKGADLFDIDPPDLGRPSQQEVLLGKGVKYVIKSIKKKDSSIYVTAKILSN